MHEGTLSPQGYHNALLEGRKTLNNAEVLWGGLYENIFLPRPTFMVPGQEGCEDFKYVTL